MEKKTDIDRLRVLIETYETSLEDRRERDMNLALDQINKYVPNSDFNQLYFHSVSSTTEEELIEEVFAREQLFHQEGEVSVRNRIIQQMICALESDDRVFAQLASAFQVLSGYAPEIAEKYREKVLAAK